MKYIRRLLSTSRVLVQIVKVKQNFKTSLSHVPAGTNYYTLYWLSESSGNTSISLPELISHNAENVIKSFNHYPFSSPCLLK